MTKVETNGLRVISKTGDVSDAGLVDRQRTAMGVALRFIEQTAADPDAASVVDPDGCSPLQRAIERANDFCRDFEPFTFKIQTLSRTTPRKSTVFEFQAETSDYAAFVETPAELLARGANPNGNAHAQGTPLETAALYGDAGTIELLVRFGADVNRSGHEGTPLEVALREGHEDAAMMLCALGVPRADWPVHFTHDDVEGFRSAWGRNETERLGAPRVH